MNTSGENAGAVPAAVWKMHRIRRSIGDLRLLLPCAGLLLLPLG